MTFRRDIVLQVIGKAGQTGRETRLLHSAQIRNTGEQSLLQLIQLCLVVS